MNEAPNLQGDSDGTLVGRIVNGDRDAATAIIRRHQRALLAFLRRVAPHSADDLFQETWIRAIRSAPSFDPTYPFPPWIFRIAWNLVRSDWRRREAAGELGDPSNTPSGAEGADDDLLARERDWRVRLLMRELPPQLAQALFLRYFEELSEKEMAERLGVPKGTIKSRLHHALRKLGPAVRKEFL